jgi:polyhydroxyalkanoate synthesis repressor PhaR
MQSEAGPSEVGDQPAATSDVNGASPAPGGAAPVVVKKYANRRLYNTESSSYITLDTLADMVHGGRDFVVYDAKTGEDITRGVLTQIIVEEESKGRALLPTAFLRQLIGFYGDSMQSFVPRYLEQAMASFTRQQEQMRRAVQQTMQHGLAPFIPLPIEEIGKQNMAMMERAMSLFSPFHRDGEAAPPPAPAAPDAPSPEPESANEVAALRAEVELLRGQLALANRPAPSSSSDTPHPDAGWSNGRVAAFPRDKQAQAATPARTPSGSSR